jgi:hypothetical protein
MGLKRLVIMLVPFPIITEVNLDDALLSSVNYPSSYAGLPSSLFPKKIKYVLLSHGFHLSPF